MNEANGKHVYQKVEAIGKEQQNINLLGKIVDGPGAK